MGSPVPELAYEALAMLMLFIQNEVMGAIYGDDEDDEEEEDVEDEEDIGEEEEYLNDEEDLDDEEEDLDEVVSELDVAVPAAKKRRLNPGRNIMIVLSKA